jgi:indolepyruvate ferredoxin oxidoreductase beta subunit
MNAISRDRPITIAILAVGGQGGGVVTDWLIDLGERNGMYVQATSVPGVAQRTGATIYYLEMIPATDRTPVLAMMPAPGDVDVVIAAELMEAGRAIQRGLVSPDRTTLIASSHRALASQYPTPIMPPASATCRIRSSSRFRAVSQCPLKPP